MATPPNKQKLGNIEFDSDKTRWHNSGKYLIAKDDKTGKDYGIVRKEDGSYDFFRGIDNKLKDKEYFKNAEKGLYEFAYNKVFNEEISKRKLNKKYIELPTDFEYRNYKLYDTANKAIDTSGIFNDVKNSPKYKYAVDKISHLEVEEENLKSDKFSKLLGVYQHKDNKIKINPSESNYSKENTVFHEAMHDISNDPNADSKKWTYGLPGIFNKGYRNYYQPEKGDKYLDDDNENYSRVTESFFDLSKMGVNLMQTPYSDFSNKDKSFIKNTISETTGRTINDDNVAQSLINATSSIPINQGYFFDGTKTNAWNDMKSKLKSGQVISKYNQGGDILGGVSKLAPLLDMAVPGLGTGIGAVAGLGAKYFNDQEMKAKQAEAALNNPANYSNQNAFGYKDGGMLQGLAQGAGLVTGSPNKVDGNQMNYKGSPIALDHGETLDTNKDRVISDKYFNPVTGKKIVDEDKALKRSRGKAEKILGNGTDSAASNTIKFAQKQEDALFRMQEMIASMSGDRDRPQDQMPQQGYALGGNLGTEPGVPTNPFYDKMNGFYDYTQDAEPKYSPELMYRLKQESHTRLNNQLNADPTSKSEVMTIGRLNKLPETLSSINPIPNLDSALNSALSEHKAGIDGTPSLQANNFWTQSTQGEKIGMAGQAASLLAKTVESFQPLQQQQTRPNTAPISLSQLDPSAILNRNQQSYQSALAANQGNTSNQNVGYQQGLFANKLNADNQALSQFQAQNASLKDNYEQRLAQRMDTNNANANQVDDIMARRRGARENMRMGVYGDVATMGMNVGSLMNTRLGNQATFGGMKNLAPDVYANYVKTLTPQMKKYLNIKD